MGLIGADGCDLTTAFLVLPARSAADLAGLGVPGHWWYLQLDEAYAAVVADAGPVAATIDRLAGWAGPFVYAEVDGSAGWARCTLFAGGHRVLEYGPDRFDDPVAAGLAAMGCPIPPADLLAAVHAPDEAGEPVCGYDSVDQLRLGKLRLRLRSAYTRDHVVNLLDALGYAWQGAERDADPLTLRAARLGLRAGDAVWTVHFRAGVLAEIRSWAREPVPDTAGPSTSAADQQQ